MNWDLCESPYDAQVRISLDSFVLKRNLPLLEHGNQRRDQKEATPNKRGADNNSNKNNTNNPQTNEENEIDLSDLVKGSRFMCGSSSTTCMSMSTCMSTSIMESSASSSFFNASSNMSMNHDESGGSFMNDSGTSLSSRKNMKRMHKKKQKYRQLLTKSNGKGDTKCAQPSFAVTSTKECHNGLTKSHSMRDDAVSSTNNEDAIVGSKRIDATLPDTKSDESISAKRKDAQESTKEPAKTIMICAERDNSKAKKVLINNEETSCSKKERNWPLDDSLHNKNKKDKQRGAHKAAESAKPATAKETTGKTICNKTNNKTRQGLAAVSVLASKNAKPEEVGRRDKLRRAMSDLGNRSALFMEVHLERDNNAHAISYKKDSFMETAPSKNSTSPPTTMDRRQVIKRTVSNLARSVGGEGIKHNKATTGHSTSPVRISRWSSAEQQHHQQLPVVNVGPASRLVGTRFEAVARAAGVNLRQNTSVAGDANASTLSRSPSLRGALSQQTCTLNATASSRNIATKSLAPKAKSARHLNKTSTTNSLEISYFDWDKYARGQCGCGLNNTIH